MQRRTFIRDAALGAVAVTASGFISFDGTRYVGDCETTTDILGPFYRPNSPVRTNLVIPDDPGTKILLSGKIKIHDCTTPFKKAKVELWHCSAKGEYDNSSDEFRYRATTFSDEEGKYFFNTILPVPYGIGDGVSRPAHYHMMIIAEGYQPLITQFVFYRRSVSKKIRHQPHLQQKEEYYLLRHLMINQKKFLSTSVFPKNSPQKLLASISCRVLTVLRE